MIYIRLMMSFFKVGLLGFGGGLAMLPLIYQTVQKFGFMSSEEFANLVALSQITPGPIAANTATYVGFNVAGVGGGIAATVGVTIPSFIMVISSMRIMDKMKDSKVFRSILYGVRPASAGLIAAAAIFVGGPSLIGKDAIKTGMLSIFTQGWGSHTLSDVFRLMIENIYFFPVLICIISMIMVSRFKWGTVKIIFIMMLVGILSSLAGV